MTITIDKDIPIPAPTRRGTPRKYPFPDMAVGDSIFVDGEGNERVAMRAALQYFTNTKAGSGRKFTTRAKGSGTRIWRIA